MVVRQSTLDQLAGRVIAGQWQDSLIGIARWTGATVYAHISCLEGFSH